MVFGKIFFFIFTFIVSIFVLLFYMFFFTCSMCSCVFHVFPSFHELHVFSVFHGYHVLHFLFFPGLDDEQVELAKEIYGAQPRRQRIDHIHNDQPGFEKGCKWQHGVHGPETEEEGCHRVVDHLPPHHPLAPHQLYHHLL